ncbi:MAG: AarF/ABC1/UbiB kinase family protein [Thaumarchaeota archaeon]|nr:AarF/ABC1/UbiB kinase family protein [Nitrososphaerota archaeon]
MPATLRAVMVLLKLLPSVIALRRDRRRWASLKDGDGGQNSAIDEDAFRSNARRMLNALISLGPVYIKLGQWLSSRADILPHPYLGELAKLQDDVPAAPFEEVRPILERELGPLGDTFEEIDKTPISGASLGQVYRAVYDGRQVAVKVRRPGIERMVKRDLAVLKKALPLALRFVDPNLRYSAQAMLSQFTESIREEMDYTAESENLKRIKRDMSSAGGGSSSSRRRRNGSNGAASSSSSSVIVPSVLDDLSSRDVLTMEYIPGIKITDIASLDEKGIDRQRLVVDVHKVFFTMLLRHSVFHADPHPGNISVTDDGRLILYDYGMVGRLDDETRMRLVRLYLALVEKDPPRTVNAMSDLGMLVPDTNREVVERGVEMTVRAMHGRKPDEMEVQSLMEMANRTMSRFPFVLPKNLALYMRMASIIEGIYKTHEVDFKFVRVLREILEEESLIKDAYVEEIKHSITRLAKSIDATISIAPELKRYLDESKPHAFGTRRRENRADANMILLSGSIFSGAVFAGSAVVYALHGAAEPAAAAGMAGSLAIMAAAAVLAHKRRHR